MTARKGKSKRGIWRKGGRRSDGEGRERGIGGGAGGKGGQDRSLI